MPRLVGEVAAREFVVAHVQKRWGELSEGEGNLIAREAGIVVRDVLSGVPARVEQSPALAPLPAGRGILKDCCW